MDKNKFHFGLFQVGRGLTLIFLVLIYNSGITAQSQEKMGYSSSLDSLWSMGTYITQMSSNGEWIALEEDFPEKGREILIWDTKGKKHYKLPSGDWLEFSAGSKTFAYISKEKELIILDFKGDKESQFANIKNYSFSNKGDYIAAIQEDSGNLQKLLIISLKTSSIVRTINDVSNFVWHPTVNTLLANVEEPEQIQLIRIDVDKDVTQQMFSDTAGNIEHFGWNDSGTTVLFVSGRKEEYKLHSYDEKQGVHSILTDLLIQKNFVNYKISNRQPYAADDGKKILFYLQSTYKPEETTTTDAEVWTTEDPWIEPRMKRYREEEEQYFLAAWYPRSGIIRIIETGELPTAIMDVNLDFALVYNKLQYEPLYKLYPNADLYVKNIESGDLTLACKNQYTGGQFVTISPKGKYISYFKDSDWWAYNVTTGTQINLTDSIQVPFQNVELQNSGDAFPYGCPGWLQNGEVIVLYDQFDIWLMSPDGKIKNRITNGRGKNIQYRIMLEDGRKKFKAYSINPNFSSKVFDPKEGIVLKIFDYNQYKTGIALWSKSNEIEPIIMIEGGIDEVNIDQKFETLIYKSQRFDRPISINRIDIETKKPNVIYQTNKGLMEYDLGFSEFIEYKLEDGTHLRGSLIYPSHYNPEKKYPMIVEIYERESRDINTFTPPSDLMDDGFNLLKFTMNDYFVLYPDISYSIGNPGISALKSVSKAVEKVLETGKIDEKKLGLIGHSFGGYETAFIVSQSNMFAAAVAGSSITNTVNYYHDVYWNLELEQMWRLENQQLRFGDSFYNMKEAYYKNSPFQQVENIQTPLLLWTGKKDNNVNWNQSIQMFMAMKRLDKKAKLLLYDREAHELENNKNQKHLSQEIFKWMGTYLKEKEEL